MIQAGNYRGINQTKLAFSSDRRGERSKEIYIMDYDGVAQKPLTANRSLNLTPTWAPDGRSLAYISYRTGTPSLHVAHIYEGRGEVFDTGEGMAINPAWSPDGSQIAFTSTRDGNSELYLIRSDGTALKRLTDHPGIDTSPCWSPTGREIAFTSDRTGAPQIYAMDTEGLNLRRISLRRQLQRLAELVALSPVQRAHLYVPDRARALRHCRLRFPDQADTTAHDRARQQRKPRLVAKRTSHHLHVDENRHEPDLHDEPKRDESAAAHTNWKQLDAAVGPVFWTGLMTTKSKGESA